MASTNVQQSDDTLHERKQAATEFLRLVVGGRIEEAYRKYVDPSGIHHNPFFPAGFAALMKAMICPRCMFPVVTLIPPNHSTMAVASIFVVLALDNASHRWFWDTDDGTPTHCPSCRAVLDENVRWGTGKCDRCCVVV